MSNHPVMQAAMRSRLQVAAIDFGTTYSGYAFSFRSDFERDPLAINAHQWNAGSGRASSLKTASCILFSPDKKFHSFGFEAEDYYASLAGNEEHQDWYYFRRFKMLLYEHANLNRRSTLRGENGREMPAITVFSECIRYLRNHLITRCEEYNNGMLETDIHWVLTVPAIWNDPAKQFMREAAVQAGIATANLSLALEPEAASMFCKYLPVNMIRGADSARLSCFNPGTRYLVLDAGGGTVDITVHKTQPDNTVIELYKANGGPWGGTAVDKAFRNFLEEITGRDAIDQFEKTYQDDYIELFREFEIKKRTIKPDLMEKATFKMPLSLYDTFRSIHGYDFRQSLIQREDIKDNVTLTGDKLRVKPAQVKRLFTETCDNIIGHLRSVLAESAVRGTSTILMVGGFSESEILQDAVKTAFPTMRVIIPAEAGLAVLKGAVIFGHNPSMITTRVAKYTYGVGTTDIFKDGIDPTSRMVVVDGKKWLQGCFDKHVEEGEEVEVGKLFASKGYIPLSRHSESVKCQVYTSRDKNPTYVDDPGCERLGDLMVNVSHIPKYEDRGITVQMEYGNTELGVVATLDKTGEKLSAQFDFLG